LVFAPMNGKGIIYHLTGKTKGNLRRLRLDELAHEGVSLSGDTIRR